MVNERPKKSLRKRATAKAKKDEEEQVVLDTTHEPREMFAIRLTPTERAALEKAAKAEDRPMGYIVRRTLMLWLKAKGYAK
jgi:hypothetical protein